MYELLLILLISHKDTLSTANIVTERGRVKRV